VSGSFPGSGTRLTCPFRSMSTPTADLDRLPPGRHGLPPEVVAENQRRRIFDATARVHRERGYAGMKVADITDRAGVSRATFYKFFAGKPQCVAAAQLDVSESLRTEILQAWAVPVEWPGQVGAAVDATLDFAAAAPERAFLLLSDPLFAEPELAQAPLAFHSFLVDLLRTGRDRVPAAQPMPALTEQAQIGAFRSVVAARLLAGREAELPAIKAELVQLMLMPYLGPWEAAELAG
jgi:AcrR family transcriptional regulator